MRSTVPAAANVHSGKWQPSTRPYLRESYLPYVRLVVESAGSKVEGDLRRSAMTQVGVPRESTGDERRVALVPRVVERLTAMGLEVVVEPGAGAGALIP